MIFELKNKMPQNSSFLYSEDVLTSTTFGNLRYFSNQYILIDFLNESIALDGKKINLSNDNQFTINFWEKHYNDPSKRYNETDLVLANDNYAIIIECKYHSPLGEEYTETDYSNQLIRYSNILLSEDFANLKKIIIYLTYEKIMPKDILLKSRKGIDKNIGLYWLSWNKLYLALMKQDKTKLPENESLLYNDLIAFLYKRNIITFCGFKIDNVSCNFHYRKQYKYININYNNEWHYKKYYSYITGRKRITWRYKK